jgi:hypothetical protein
MAHADAATRNKRASSEIRAARVRKAMYPAAAEDPGARNRRLADYLEATLDIPLLRRQAG